MMVNFYFFYFKGIFSKGFWKLSSQVVHPDLKTLFVNLNSTIVNARAKITVMKYIGAFKIFMSWAENYSEITSVLPCSEIKYIRLRIT